MERIKGLKGHEINVIIPQIPVDYKKDANYGSKPLQIIKKRAKRVRIDQGIGGAARACKREARN